MSLGTEISFQSILAFAMYLISSDFDFAFYVGIAHLDEIFVFCFSNHFFGFAVV